MAVVFFLMLTLVVWLSKLNNLAKTKMKKKTYLKETYFSHFIIPVILVCKTTKEENCCRDKIHTNIVFQSYKYTKFSSNSSCNYK